MDKELTYALKCVCQGYSESIFNNKEIFFKHFGLMDHVDVDEEYNKAFDRARAKGVPTDEEQIQFCIEYGTWTQKKEDDLKRLIERAEYTEKSLHKLIFGNQKIKTEQELLKIKQKINELSAERDEVIGMTAEGYAQKRSNEYFLYYSSFRDVSLKEPFFDKEEFEDLSEIQLNLLVALSIKERQKIESEKLKRVVIDSFFMNMYRLVKDPVQLFQKPILDLSYPQVEFLTYAEMFKTILSESEVPDSVRDDPEKLIDWYNAKHTTLREVEKHASKKGDLGLVAVPGATKEQMESLGLGEGMDLKKTLQKKGNMSAKELMRVI